MVKKSVLYVSTFILIFVLSLAPASSFAKDTLIIGLQDDTASLDPAKSFETAAGGIMRQIYENLVGFGEEDSTRVVPKLAESWELGDDGKTWTFHLRQGIAFASGNPVNADAVVFSLRRSLKLASGPFWILTQFGITEASVTKLDEYTVQIVLDHQYAPGLFLSCLIHSVAYILDQKEVIAHEQDGDMGNAWLEDHSAGSGPYILQERKKETPTHYVLTANEHYWGKLPKFKQVLVKGVQEAIEQMVLLEQGDIDIAWNLQPDQVQILGNNPNIRLSETHTLYLVYVGMNQGYAPLQRIEVRDAIRYAIDYDGIIENVMQGAGVKTQTFIPKGLLGYNPAVPYTQDVQKARQLLAQRGYPNGFDVELNCLNYSPWLDIAMKIKSDLAEIGIKVRIVQLTPDKMVEVLFKRETQLWFWEFGVDYADPDAMAKQFAHSDSLGDDATVKQLAWWFKYVNKETSKLVEQAAQELDPQKRAELYKQITEIILHDGPFAFLFTKIHQYGVRVEIADFIRNPSVLVSPFPQLK
jgi:peptide/nickel transport system substrate-binding protein